MILVTHGIVGSAIGVAYATEPVLGASLAFLSHFILDAIPHWDYEIKAIEGSGEFMDSHIGHDHDHTRDSFIKVGLDGLLGLLVPILLCYIFNLPIVFALLGAGCAILPDFLQFVYLKTHTKFLYHFMKFHSAIHSNIRLDKKPLLGLSLQAIVWGMAIVYMVYI